MGHKEVVLVITDEVRKSLMTDWVKPQDAARIAGVSYGWMKLLGERGKVETLQTPLGMLYKREQVEEIGRQRESKGAA